MTLTVWDEDGNQAVETLKVTVVNYTWLWIGLVLVVVVVVVGGLFYVQSRKQA